MRLLVVSNLYPPESLGGYELQCEQAVVGLRRRGHHVEVLTSGRRQRDPTGIHRILRLHPPPPPAGARAVRWHALRVGDYLANRYAARRLVGRVRPDALVCWSMERAGVAVVGPAVRRGIPVIVFLDDWSLIDEWRVLTGEDRRTGPVGGRTGRVFQAALDRLRRTVRVDHAVFVSDFVRRVYADSGVPLGAGEVIHQGARFTPPPLAGLRLPAPDRLVYAGRVARTKGCGLAVETLRLLRDRHGLPSARLTIVGPLDREDPAYGEELRESISEAGLDDAVDILGPRPPAEVHEIIAAHRVLLFTSGWEEPGPAVPLEALGHGVPVVTTDVGGMRDYVRDGVDGFVVPRQDAEAMAAATARLLTDGDLWAAMRAAGWQRVVSYFSDERFLDEVEALLRRRAAPA